MHECNSRYIMIERQIY